MTSKICPFFLQRHIHFAMFLRSCYCPVVPFEATFVCLIRLSASNEVAGPTDSHPHHHRLLTTHGKSYGTQNEP